MLSASVSVIYFFIEFSIESHFISMQSVIRFSDSAIITFRLFDSSLSCCSMCNSARVCGAITKYLYWYI